MKKKILYIGIVMLTLIVGITFYTLKRKNNRVHYKTMKVERGAIASTVLASGTLNPVVLVSVGSQVSGTIQRIYADFNSPVRKGQVIAQIDPSLFQAEVEKARANHRNALAICQQRQTQVTDTKRTLDRYQELIKNELVAQSEVDTAETSYQSAVAALHAAEAAVLQAKAALDLAESNRGYTTIHSPLTGIVVSRNVDAGQTVAASFQAPVLFTIAQDLTKMQIDTSVDEADIGMVRVGQKAGFTVDAYPGRTFLGKILQVRNAPQMVQNVVTYDVIVSVDNPLLQLKPGMTANVSILIEERSNVIKIPAAALRFQPPEAKGQKPMPQDSKGPRVWKLLAENNLQPVAVKVGVSNGQYAELVEGDLKEGDLLAIETVSPAQEAASKKPSGLRVF